MNDNRPPLPKGAQEIADVIGRDATMRLIGALRPCGARPWRRFLYVPAELTPDHQLVRILGWPTAEKLVYAFRGIILEPPACTHLSVQLRNRVMAQRFCEGATPRLLAAEFGLTYEQVRNVLQGQGLWTQWLARAR